MLVYALAWDEMFCMRQDGVLPDLLQSADRIRFPGVPPFTLQENCTARFVFASFGLSLPAV